MTKKKAIEVAMERWVEARRHLVAVDVEDVIAGACVEKAYDLGRIAGLREAAKRCFGLQENGIKMDLRKYANLLAKKARKHGE